MKLLLALVAALACASTATAQSTNKKLCDGFENSEALRGGNCPNTGQPKISNGARQQCLELMNFSTSNKRVRLDQKTIDKCLAARNDYTKSRDRSRAKADVMRKACDAAVAGQQKAGQGCDSAFECEAGLACIGKLGGPPGRCVKPLTAGAACNSESLNASALHHLVSITRPPCGPGLRCADTSKGLACVAVLADGAACNGPADLSACAVGSKCLSGKCVAETRRPAGEGCMADVDCLVGDRCDRDRCIAGKKSGLSCAGPRECLSGDCTAGKCAARCGSG